MHIPSKIICTGGASGTDFPIEMIRTMFPSLAVTDGGRRRIYFDNPAGTQVPKGMIDAVSEFFLSYNSNSGVFNATSVAVDAMTARTYGALADFVNTDDPGEVFIGPNMTTMTYQLSRGLAHHFQEGDEIILTQMDHEGNVSPWLQMAQDRGVVIHWLPFNRETWRIELDDLATVLTDRTKLLALNYASNLTGAINDVATLTAAAQEAGALVYVDAVQLAPHRAIDVKALKCDFLACSPYKFFGPHLGVVWGKRDHLESIPAYKVRCAGDGLPDRFVTGTQQFELIAGLLATLSYLEDVGRMAGGSGDRRSLLTTAYRHMNRYEERLSAYLLGRFEGISEIELLGPRRPADRVPTFSFLHSEIGPQALAEILSNDGVFCHWGHNYAYEVSKALNLDPIDGAVRIGFAHYNTIDEIDEFVACLERMLDDR
jgi:cysteine desulfurase family protein (TIGR01976 family)